MAQIHNTDLFKELKEGIRLQQLNDVVPSQLADKVVPVMEVNPKLLRMITRSIFTTATATGTSTIFNTPVNQDFYVTGSILSLSDDVTSDGIQAYITVYVNGEVVRINSILKSPLTLTAINNSIMLPMPIKCDRNSTISSTSAFTVGASRRSCVVMGYIDDVSKA